LTAGGRDDLRDFFGPKNFFTKDKIASEVAMPAYEFKLCCKPRPKRFLISRKIVFNPLEEQLQRILKKMNHDLSLGRRDLQTFG